MPQPASPHPFAERLRMLRSKSKLTQEALAEVAGVSQNAIGTWERGESSPQVRELGLLCDFFDVSADYLTGRSDYPSGIAPDSWIVDVDAVESPIDGDSWCVKVPRRMRIVSYEEMRRIEADTESRRRKPPKGRGRGNAANT